MQVNLIQQYNRYMNGENRSLIAKSLAGAAGTGGNALIPQHLEQVVTNAVPRLSPELAVMTPKFDNQSLHEFNQLTALNAIGAAMGEGSTTPTTQPTFTRQNVQLKVLKKKGSTTDFLRWSSSKNIDSAAANVEATLTALVHDMANYNFYGNGPMTVTTGAVVGSGNLYEYNGFDYFISTNRIQNASGGTAITSLATLDDMIDRNIELQGINHNKAFFMSPRMLSRISQLYTNVRDVREIAGQFGQVDIPGGWRVNSYRDVPIIMSGACQPKETMTTVTPTGADSGGTILDNVTRYFQVAGITKNGEQIACAEVSRASGSSGAGNVHTMILTWAANAAVYRWKIYVGTASGTVYLRHIIPNFTYNTSGTIAVSTTTTLTGVKTYTSDANGQVTTCTFLSDPNTAGAEVASGMQLDIPLVLNNGVAPELIWMIDLDEYQGMGRQPYTNEGGSQFNGLISMEMLAKVDSELPFLLQSYTAVCPSYEATSVLNRGLRIQ
jgi:hypothetical protein